MTLDELNQVSEAEFVAALADIFEHSPWVAKHVIPGRPFASIERLHAAMTDTVSAATSAQQLELINAHPDLAGKAALSNTLTRASKAEQSGAGLDQLNASELSQFHALNEAYRSRFQFPFIIAVNGLDKYSILSAYEPRLRHDRDEEVETALSEIAKIGSFRLEHLLQTRP